VLAALGWVEAQSGKQFGSPKKTLLVSICSGAKFSMPGMMDTVLNLGLNDQVAAGMITLTKDLRFVYDSYRRLIQIFGSVVMGIHDEPFEKFLTETKQQRGIKLDVDLNADDWKMVTAQFKKIYFISVEDEFPQDPLVQLVLAVESVFKSWNGRRAFDYRNAARISHNLGTAVNVQMMVFGNMGQDSGAGVAFTRNPSSGDKNSSAII
jgi:pyruvate,orthophosphate dikinase